MGLQIHANTPATSVARAADGTWQVTTPRGTVVAKEVVLATNGYTTALDPRFQGVVVPIHGDSFIYRNGFEYMVSRRAEDGGDIIIGGGLYENGDGGVGRGWKHRRHRDERSDQLVSQGNNSEIFRDQLGRKAPRRTRTGIMGYSADGYPLVGRMPNSHSQDVLACCSFQGHGMVLCWMSAKALVEMIQGRDNEDLKAWFPDAFRVTEERFQRRFQGPV
ncbi:hypothetical protein PoMZ_11769 [Pyricularia oryzae]|uniref:FAD dependent oxidoreductase domain-containing protein n=1 Tax=Pyricularia oryzae TaxID=318829 RepID=A0A4P7NLN1_PYROR|nr:hypothetical protein PoMZ_11769 [Pyricularia oryzae]